MSHVACGDTLLRHVNHFVQGEEGRVSTDSADCVDDDRTVAIAMLRRAGLFPPPSELAAVLANYAGFRALTVSLYGVDEARYEEPSITFTADVGVGGTASRGD